MKMCKIFLAFKSTERTANTYKKLDTQANRDPPINALHVACNLHPLSVTL